MVYDIQNHRSQNSRPWGTWISQPQKSSAEQHVLVRQQTATLSMQSIYQAFIVFLIVTKLWCMLRGGWGVDAKPFLKAPLLLSVIKARIIKLGGGIYSHVVYGCLSMKLDTHLHFNVLTWYHPKGHVTQNGCHRGSLVPSRTIPVGPSGDKRNFLLSHHVPKTWHPITIPLHCMSHDKPMPTKLKP
jgi:hypothetical protein